MGLSKKEQAMLEALNEKANQPDPEPIGKNVSFSIDLADDNQIKKAQKLGLLPSLDDDDDGDDDDDDDQKPDDPPRRRSYFKEGSKS